jgi:hypothetical protein
MCPGHYRQEPAEKGNASASGFGLRVGAAFLSTLGTRNFRAGLQEKKKAAAIRGFRSELSHEPGS